LFRRIPVFGDIIGVGPAVSRAQRLSTRVKDEI
jgi:hypothetical protein